MGKLLLENEISKFKKESGIGKLKLSLYKKENYIFALEKAFSDAFGQYARKERHNL